MEDKREGELPPGYSNLNYDADVEAGPSAPNIYEHEFVEGEPETIPVPTAPPPKYEEAGSSSDPNFIEELCTTPIPDTLRFNPPTLVFEDIFEACVLYAKANCCYSTRFARQMKLTEINNDCAFHYTLESFGEKRESATQSTPYKGGPIDGPENGPPPRPWDMIVRPPALFMDSKSKVVIPHTDYVYTCTRCSGRGKVTCSSCNGKGYDRCWSCSGSGSTHRDGQRHTCTSCGGRGRRTCSRCWGSGRMTCPRCDGHGRLKDYKLLIVTWTNHLTDFVSDVRSLPAKKIRKGTGDILLAEEKQNLLPIRNAPISSVNDASVHLLEAHRNSFRTELFRKQRHSLRAVPFTVAKYKWKEEEGEFYVFGKEKEVYFEAYPTSCCCCICC